MAGKETQIKSRMAVTEVAGTVDTDAIVEALVAKCGAEVVEDDGTGKMHGAVCLSLADTGKIKHRLGTEALE
jgi:hypothetical protein